MAKAAKRALANLEKLKPEEIQAMRFDEPSQAQFDELLQRLSQSSDALHAVASSETDAMTDEEYELRTASEAEQSRNALAMVHFLAPRIMRLREGEGKRRWKSLLAKFRKDQMLA